MNAFDLGRLLSEYDSEVVGGGVLFYVMNRPYVAIVDRKSVILYEPESLTKSYRMAEPDRYGIDNFVLHDDTKYITGRRARESRHPLVDSIVDDLINHILDDKTEDTPIRRSLIQAVSSYDRDYSICGSSIAFVFDGVFYEVSVEYIESSGYEVTLVRPAAKRVISATINHRNLSRETSHKRKSSSVFVSDEFSSISRDTLYTLLMRVRREYT